MKKIISIVVLVFAFTVTAQAQKKGGKMSADKMVKKMTKELDLTADQQTKLLPIFEAQLADRKAMNETRKAAKGAGTKPSKEERVKMKKERDAAETEMNTKLASILTEEQMTTYNTLKKEQKGKGKGKEKGKGKGKGKKNKE
ncbi:Spy/CpxP family protein refolding chaperone [Polaribacter sp.]|uniref:Spy/CpxP family protein refolding chaperone n=1 Tax=Polaribacter sp. TaxID=1920175 RepID=UPI003EF221FD